MKKIIAITAFCALVLLIAPGCYKVATVRLDNSPAITKSVSLSKDIVPIFSKNCALSGCHSSGGHVPDLSVNDAYNSLIKGKYIDISSPSNSALYLWLTGKKAESMPLGSSNNPSDINALTLAWITQGANNN